MSEIILSTKKLSKKFGATYALKNVSLNVKRGQIYGLVGKNGSGKTTLMRLICGQSPISSGCLSLFGIRDPKEYGEARTRIGCMIESSAFYPHLSARKNLKIYGIKKGLPVITGQIDDLLSFVGLADVGNKKFSDFSLGMKARLGLALALLGDPELLILDEPANGLDPIGIALVRDVILKLNKERGVTVIISSHILKELGSIATHFGFIDHGRLIRQLSSEELHSRCLSALSIKVNDPEKALVVLENICNCRNFKIFPNGIIMCYDKVDSPDQLNLALSENGIKVYSLVQEGQGLENYFINLVEGGIDD